MVIPWLANTPTYHIIGSPTPLIPPTVTEPKNYSTIRSILKKEQGEKIAPYVFKINDTQTLQEYLDQEKITYEIYQEERKIINHKRTLTPTYNKPRKKRKLEDR